LIVDISNPSSPVLNGSYDTAGNACDVSVSGNYAYIADSNNGLTILDISNPSSPVLKGSYNTTGYAQRVVVSGNYAYVAVDDNLVIVDISNPSSPILKGRYAVSASDVSVSDNYVYVTEGVNGIIILKTNPGKTAPLFADFSSNITSGCSPLSVQFNDSSQNATAWNWNFGDGFNSTNQNPVHTYSSAGTYTVNLIVSNANKAASKTATIIVLETTGSDEGSSDGDEEKSAGVISRKETGNLTKESKKIPEFTIVCGIISLLAAFYITELNKR
jgi:hypothetical protein